MAKRRSLQEDTVALSTKVKESSAKSENLEGNAAIRSLRKRLKRAQRKIRTAKQREVLRTAKKADTAK
ncbi:MAG: hypothetical protein ACQ9IQ_09410 [Nitrospirales bacterium]